MPRVQYKTPAFPTAFGPQMDEPAGPEPTWSEAFDAAFGLENDVKNAYDLMTRPKFPRDPNYPLVERLKDTPFWDEYRENFIGVESDEELQWRMDKIRQEVKDRETLQRAGWAGTTAMVAAGIVSPTIFIPFAGAGARGWKLVKSAATLGAVGAGVQETALLANQETRTAEEAAFSMAASTVLSGLLGGAVARLRPGEFAKLEAGIANSPRETAISPRPVAAGAASTVAAHAGAMDPGPFGAAGYLAKGVDSNPITRSPVIDALNSDSRASQWAMAQMDDGGVSLIGNTYGVPTTPGGTVSNRVTTWYGNFWKSTSAHDDAYNKYFFDRTVPQILDTTRAAVANLTGALGGKISRQQFNQEVAEAFHNGDVHPRANEPFAAAATEAAKAWRKDLYDPILKALQDSKVFSHLDEVGETEQTDKSYLNWIFHHGLISARPGEFIDFLQKEFNDIYQAEFAKRLEKFQVKERETKELIEDIQTPEDAIEEMRDIYGAELRDVEEGAARSHVVALEDTIAELRSRARELQKETGDFKLDVQNREYRKQLLRDARDLERSEAERLKPIKEQRRRLKRRLSNLNKAQVVLEERVVKKLEKIEKAEDLSLGTLNRAARAAQKHLAKLDKVSDEELDEVAETLRGQFARTAEMYDRGEERLARMVRDEDTLSDTGVFREAAQQEGRADRLTEIAKQLEDAEGMDRAALRGLLQAGLDEVLSRAQSIVSRRALRNAKLMEQARTLAPDTLAERIAKLVEGRRLARQTLEESTLSKGDEISVDLDKGVADFSKQAKADAQRVMHTIQGTYVRLPVVEVAQGERGSVLARNLGFIPTERMKPWLEMDIEKLARTHVRTMAPDLEIAKKFGTIDLGEIFTPLVKEYDAKVDALRTATDKRGKPLSKAAQEKRATALAQDLARQKGNIEAVFRRLRHQHGIPTNPDGMGYRLARTVQNLNVLRYMGNVTISSIPDLARPIMRHGAWVFRGGFTPMVQNLKNFRATAQWLKHAGVGVDVTLNTRIMAMNDILDDLQRGSKFERGVEWMTNRMGIVALFNYWTDTLKQFTGTIAHARLMDSIGTVMDVQTRTVKRKQPVLQKDGTFKDEEVSVIVPVESKAVKDATSYLAQVGLGPKEVEEIWKHAQATGGVSKANGVWLPNTEQWDASSSSYRNYMAALAREVNNNIVTPGVERPIWTTASETGRMIAQFKSFSFSSTQKTLLAGLQQRDAAFVVGSAISLALGALSYYIYASLAGGETEQKMQNAGLDLWTDEAIDRSGLLGVFGPARDLLSRIPTTAPYATFSGGRTTRRGGDNLMDALLGPSFDFANTAADVVTGIDDPTQSTVHSARKLLPYQNTTGPIPYLFQLRSAYDMVEKANTFNLPETRR